MLPKTRQKRHQDFHPVALERAVLTRSREEREVISMRYHHAPEYPPGDWRDDDTFLFFFAFFAPSREERPDLG
jgi:hypothetical protein